MQIMYNISVPNANSIIIFKYSIKLDTIFHPQKFVYSIKIKDSYESIFIIILGGIQCQYQSKSDQKQVVESGERIIKRKLSR